MSTLVQFGSGLLTVLALLGLPSASAQTFPNKSIRVIVAFGPGGITDTIARTVGQKMSERFGHPVVIENRGGAGGTVGARLAAAAAPDGHTLLVHTVAVAINRTASKEAPDPLTELTPIAIAASAPTIFAVHNSNPAKSLGEYLETIRRTKSGRFSFGSAGIGTAEHLIAEFLFKTRGGFDATHVPFQGGTAPINAVLGQQVDMAVTTIPTSFAHIKQGGLKVLAVATRGRVALIPDVPTLAEAGFADGENASWVAFFGPAGIPAPLVTTLHAEINRALDQPDVRERLTAIGLDARTRSQAEFGDYLKAEVVRWAQVVKATGVTPD